MAQISRPFQIALAAVVLLALVWVFALRAHGSNPSEPAPASPPTAVAKAARDAAAQRRADRASAAHTTVAHQAATHKTVVHKTVVHSTAAHKTVAHKTVVATHGAAADPHKVVRVQHKVVVAPAHKTATPPHKTASVSHKVVAIPRTHAVIVPSGSSHSKVGKQHQSPAAQLAVEAELARSKTVMLVFWNPHSAVDKEVHSQAAALVSGSKGAVVMHSALAGEVNMFGKITEVVRVYQTPTILIVNRHGVVSTLTGLTEVFALRQAVREAQHAGK
jgi:hypothetical protein